MAQDRQTTSMQFSEALGCLGRAKNLLILLIFLCLLVQMVAFVLVDFAGVINGAPQLPVFATAYEPDSNDDSNSDGSAAADDDAIGSGGADAAAAETWYQIISWSLAATKFLAVVAAGLLMLTVMFGVKVSLVGRVGAPGGFLGAFFWSLILLAMLVPWQQLIGSALASGATFNMFQLVTHAQWAQTSWVPGKTDAGLLTHLCYYARFLAYPILTLLVAAMVCLKFGRGYRPLRQVSGEDITPAPPAAGPTAAPESSSIKL